MEREIFNKSYCDISICPKDIKYPLNNNLYSNYSVPLEDIFKCYNSNTNQIFKKNDGDILNDKTIVLNPQINDQRYNNSYKNVHIDGRLVDPIRDIRMNFQKPPLPSKVNLKDIYNDDFNYNEQSYNTYKDINLGNITYKIPGYNNNTDPFNPIVFNTENHNIMGYIYKDPMDNYKSQYFLKQKNIKQKNKDNCNTLSWLTDSEKFRSDIMVGQMSNQNQSNYSARWYK